MVGNKKLQVVSKGERVAFLETVQMLTEKGAGPDVHGAD